LFLCSDLPNIDNKWLDKIISLWKEKFPFEYIINKAEFYGLELYVDERVLIPRNDTEIMVDQTINNINNCTSKLVYIDIWTGSSCIPIAVLKNINLDKVDKSYVIDISKKALEVSYININTHKLYNIIIQFEWSLLTPVIGKINKVDTIVITANLPYIKDNDHDNMDNQTVEYEPDNALYWGPVTWFELYEELIQQCLSLKESWNINTINLFIEIWFDQEVYSQNYLNNLWLKYNLFKDNWWIVRCIWVNI
jgi:release factor glutamine methyltransferase